MANPCFYTYKGKRYTYEEFATLLHDGELHNLANEGIVQGDFVNSMPEELKVTVNERKENGDIIANATVRPTTEQVGEVAVTEKPTSKVAKTPSMEPATQPKSSEGVVEVKKGKEIEPRAEVSTDTETVKKELKLDPIDSVIYDEFHNVPKSEVGKKFEKIKDDKLGEIEKIESDINDLDIKIEDNSIEIDQIKEAENLTSAQKKKQVAEKEKEYKEFQKQQKELEAKKSDAEKFLEDFESRLFHSEEDFNQEAIDKVVNRVNTRLETRKAVKNGTDLFPETANIPEIENKKPTETRKEARIKIADAKIDDFANALKDLLPKGADLSGLKKQGLSQDDIIDIIAKGAKELAKTGIEIDEAIRQVISKLKEHFEDLNVDEKAVMEKHFAEEEPIIADGEKYYSLKKSFVDAEREAKGKEELHGIVADERKQAEVQQDIKKRIDNGEIKQQEIDDLMQALAVNDVDFRTRFNTREQNAIMLHEQARLDKKEFEIISSLKTIPENTKEYSDAVFELARTQILADQNQQAIKNTGREAGKNLADRKGFVDGDFTRPGIIKRLEEVSKDKEVSKEQREEASKMAQQIKELQSKIDDYETRFKQHDEEVKKLEQQKAELEEKTAKTRAEEKLEKLQKLKSAKEYKKADIERKKKDTIASIKEKYKRLSGNVSTGGNLKLLELAPEITALAKLHVQEGVVELEELMGKMLVELKDAIPDLTERDLRDIFSGYGKSVKPSENELAKTLSELKSKARALSGLEDVKELGIAPARSGISHRPPTEEVKALRREIQREMREKGIDISKSKNPEDLWKTALEAYKTKINNRIEYLENIAKTENVEKFLKDKKKTKLKLDEEAKELKKKQQQIKNKVDNMVAKADFDTWSKLRKASHYAGRYMKGVLISHPVTIVKILASVAWRSAYKVPQAVSMYGASKLSKLVGSDIHKVQGINSAKDLKDHISDYYREQYSRENLRAFKETFLNHKSAEDILLGKHYAEVELPKIRGNKNLNPAQKMFFAHLYFLENISASSHGATKNLASLPEQKAWRNTILRNLIKEGIPESMMQDGSAIVIADQLGFLKGQRARFMQDNMLASQKSALTSYLSNKDMAIAGDIIDMAFPILKIGSNYVGESLEKMPGIGLVPHAVRKLSMKKGQVFNEKQKADLLRALSNQGVGMFSLLAGAMLYQNINPFYGTNAEDYAKKHGKKLPEDEEAIWKLDGVFTHSPDAVMMKAGAQMMWYWDMYDRAHPGENMSNAMMAILNWETTASIINQSPYISSTENTVSPLLKGEGIGKSMANNLRSRVPFGDFTKTIAEGKLPIFNKLAPKTGDELAKKLGLHPEEVKPSELKIYPKGFADNILIGLPGWREDVLKRLYDEEYGTGKMIKDLDKMIEESKNRGEKEIKKQKFLKGLNE